MIKKDIMYFLKFTILIISSIVLSAPICRAKILPVIGIDQNWHHQDVIERVRQEFAPLDIDEYTFGPCDYYVDPGTDEIKLLFLSINPINGCMLDTLPCMLHVIDTSTSEIQQTYEFEDGKVRRIGIE